MKKIRKFLKISGIVLLLIIGLVGIYSLNSYLKKERLLIYSKGTNEKAFLNATWKMSIKEVERANGCGLTKGISFAVIEPELNKILDLKRFVSKKSCEINIWGADREVSYDFFDDQLFRVRIYDDILNQGEIDSLIVQSLEPKYGEIIRSENNKYAGKFMTDEVEIDYNQWEYDNEEGKKVKRFRIEITYKPLINEIKSISEKEQNNIF